MGVPEDVQTFRAEARAHAAAQPRALAELPTGTYERVPTPGAPVDELMVYRPAGVDEAPGVFVNLHGGGFVLGDWAADDPYCRLLADRAGCAVINVDYILAPEHPFPAAVRQTYALVSWLAEEAARLGLDGTRLAVGGHSAGGNLAAAICLLARDRGGPMLRGQLLDYPPLDLATAPGDKRPAADGESDAAAHEAEVAARFNAWYLPTPELGSDPLASPVLAQDLSGLPPALVITAEHDVLRAEGDRYAERLTAAGVPTEHISVAGAGHAFTHVGPQEQAAAAWASMAAFLRRVLT